MNIFHLLAEIEKVDPEVYERLDSRRRVFQHMSGLGKTLAASALPLAFGSILNKAYAQTTSAPSILEVLNFALKLEYVEVNFYNQGLGAPGASPSAVQTALRTGYSATNLTALDKIRTDENNHVSFLRTAITQAGGTPITAPALTEFDYTGGKGSQAGPFAGVFVNPTLFISVAQTLEDNGGRAYRGSAPLLNSNKTILEAALNIHSVEARHSSRLRTMRRGGPSNNAASQSVAGNLNSAPKSWVSGNDNGGPQPPQTAPVYGPGQQPAFLPASSGITFPGEDNVTQGGVNLQTALASLNFPASAFSEAFDEPLDMMTAATNARVFLVAGSTFI